jgi:hypothetical protein
MAHHLLEFINAYRFGDTVAVEVGYHMHLPRAEALGQKKYINIILQHSKVLYRDNKYSWLQKWQMNRFLQRYDASTSKRCVYHDEFLEHVNRLFLKFLCPEASSVSLNRVCTWGMLSYVAPLQIFDTLPNLTI